MRRQACVRYIGVAAAIVVVLLAAGVHADPGRKLRGTTTQLSRELLMDMGVPDGAEILLQSKSNCPYPLPTQYRPKSALICESTRRSRSCLGIGPKAPMFIQEKCKGHDCALELVPPRYDCFLNAKGIHRNVTDPNLDEFCGIKAEDHDDWLKTGFQKSGCWSALPNGVLSDIRLECVNGNITALNFHVKFSKPQLVMPENEFYTCKMSLTCLTTVPQGVIVCYKNRKQKISENGDTSENDPSSGGKEQEVQYTVNEDFLEMAGEQGDVSSNALGIGFDISQYLFFLLLSFSAFRFM